jgi:hypothetical protein
LIPVENIVSPAPAATAPAVAGTATPDCVETAPDPDTVVAVIPAVEATEPTVNAPVVVISEFALRAGS